MNKEEFQKAYSKIVAKAWADDDYRANLIKDPMTVFAENGMTIPEGVEVRILENTESVFNLILPDKPSEELHDSQLD